MTHYEVVERFVGYALLRARPKTGRTHQIRLHLTHAGYPVLCDRLYAGRNPKKISELELIPREKMGQDTAGDGAASANRCSPGTRSTPIAWRSTIRRAASEWSSKPRSPPTWNTRRLRRWRSMSLTQAQALIAQVGGPILCDLALR